MLPVKLIPDAMRASRGIDRYVKVCLKICYPRGPILRSGITSRANLKRVVLQSVYQTHFR